MRVIAILLLAISCAWVHAQDDKPSSANKFEWVACSKDGKKYEGKGETYLVNKAFRQVQKELDRLSKDGKVEDGLKFDVSLKWKGKDFKRPITAHSKYPVNFKPSR